MATESIKKPYSPSWQLLVNDLTTANAVYDKTHTITYPENHSELMFTMQRASNGRTFASAIVPAQQFNNGALYADGYFGVTTAAQDIHAVCIDVGNSQVEISVPSVNEAIRVRLYAR